MDNQILIKQIEKDLDDVEHYSPTIPLHYDKYHSYIRQLIDIINNKEATLERVRSFPLMNPDNKYLLQ